MRKSNEAMGHGVADGGLRVEKTYWALVRGVPSDMPRGPGGLLRTKLALGIPGTQPPRGAPGSLKEEQEEETEEEEEDEEGLEEGWQRSEDRRTGMAKERLALTRWRVLARSPQGWAWLLLQPITGWSLPPSFPPSLQFCRDFRR